MESKAANRSVSQMKDQEASQPAKKPVEKKEVVIPRNPRGIATMGDGTLACADQYGGDRDRRD